MATPEHATALLQTARRDHDALLATAALPQVADSIYGFHAQQSVEKALKAWLALRDERYPLTHDLPDAAQQEVLDFAESLHARLERAAMQQERAAWRGLSLESALRDMDEEPSLYDDSDLKERFR